MLRSGFPKVFALTCWWGTQGRPWLLYDAWPERMASLYPKGRWLPLNTWAYTYTCGSENGEVYKLLIIITNVPFILVFLILKEERGQTKDVFSLRQWRTIILLPFIWLGITCDSVLSVNIHQPSVLRRGHYLNKAGSVTWQSRFWKTFMFTQLFQDFSNFISYCA